MLAEGWQESAAGRVRKQRQGEDEGESCHLQYAAIREGAVPRW